MNKKKEIKKTIASPIRVIAMVAMLIIGVVLALNWEDVTTEKDGKTVLAPEREKEREREKDQIENCETYKLVAMNDGWYECSLCPNGSCFLKKDEVWKYGMTCSVPRYSATYLKDYNVRYVQLKTGNFAECRTLEIDLIADYPLLPENLARPKELRLVVPPGHKRKNLE